MYERFTEGAKRSITQAKLEAAETGSSVIETHHLLQGIITGDRDLIQNALGNFARDAIQEQLLRNRRSGVSPNPDDIPLSADSKRVLAAAEEEADRHGDSQVGGQHILLGLLRESKGLAGQLLKKNVQANEIRRRLGFAAMEESSSGGFLGRLKKTFSGSKS